MEKEKVELILLRDGTMHGRKDEHVFVDEETAKQLTNIRTNSKGVQFRLARYPHEKMPEATIGSLTMGEAASLGMRNEVQTPKDDILPTQLRHNEPKAENETMAIATENAFGAVEPQKGAPMKDQKETHEMPGSQVAPAAPMAAPLKPAVDTNALGEKHAAQPAVPADAKTKAEVEKENDIKEGVSTEERQTEESLATKMAREQGLDEEVKRETEDGTPKDAVAKSEEEKAEEEKKHTMPITDAPRPPQQDKMGVKHPKGHRDQSNPRK